MEILAAGGLVYQSYFQLFMPKSALFPCRHRHVGCCFQHGAFLLWLKFLNLPSFPEVNTVLSAKLANITDLSCWF